MVRTYKIAPDGSIQLPSDALAALGADPGDEVTLILDSRRKSVRIERYSEDPWADALREKKSKGLDDLFAEQKKREAAAEDLFNQRLRASQERDGTDTE
jgi:bifunctional DNA-binding transcriptional regulator/antitoxin component of YhaV-PrlF toxin-antitoxin module